jgi:hypothetical protein
MIGGGGHRWRVNINRNNEKIIWESKNEPIIIQTYDNNIYLCCFVRYSEREAKYEFYRYDSKEKNWDICSKREFPKVIAIQNTNFSSTGPEKDDTLSLDYNNVGFLYTETAGLWRYLLSNNEIEELDYLFNDKDINNLMTFKKKYIKKLE